MSITLFNHDVHSACQMTGVFFALFKTIEDMHGSCLVDIELWNQIIVSKSEPGVYRNPCFVSIPIFFPHTAGHPFPYIPLPETYQHLTPDTKRPAWLSTQIEIRISPPIWELHHDLSLLEDPPSACTVEIRLLDPLFQKFVEIDHEIFDKPVTVFNEHIATHDDLRALIDSPGIQMKYMHRCNSRQPITQLIWSNLVHSRIHKNSFALELPFLLRMISNSDDHRDIPTGIVVLAVSDETLNRAGLPENQRGIGLYSANINLILMHPKSKITPLTYYLWPDIQPNFPELMPPNCRVAVFFSNVRFVAMATKEELCVMAARRNVIWDFLCCAHKHEDRNETLEAWTGSSPAHQDSRGS